MAEKETDTGSEKAKAQEASGEYRRDLYEKSWEGIDPEVRKKHEDRMRKGLKDKNYPNFDAQVPATIREPTVSPLIQVYPGKKKSPLHDNPRSTE